MINKKLKNYCLFLSIILVFSFGLESYSGAENMMLEESILDEKWQVEDFLIDGDSILGLSNMGKEKIKENKDLVFPDEVDGIGIRFIRSKDFVKKGIEKIEFPSDLEEISDGTFMANEIRSLSFPKSLKYIGKNAFRMSKLEFVDFNEGIEEIGTTAFYDNNIEDVEIPSSLKVISGSCFYKNPIKNLKLNEGLEEIQGGAFQNSELKEIDLPRSILRISDSLSNRDIILNYDYELENISEFPFKILDSKDRELAISWKIHRDGYEGRIENLENILIRLTRVKNEEDNKSWTREDFLIENQTIVGLSEGGKDRLKEDKYLIIPNLNSKDENIRYIGKNAFSGLDLEKVELPNKLEIIGERAFAGIKSLKYIEFPDSLRQIKKDAFIVSGLRGIKLNEGLESIEEQAFFNNELEELTIPSSLRKLDYQAFKDNNISKLEIREGLEKIGPHSLRGNNFETFKMPNSLRYIDEGGVSYSGIKNVIFSENLQVVGPKAFCTNKLEEIYIPKSLKYFGPNTFRKNPGFEKGDFPIYVDEIVELEDNMTNLEIEKFLDENIDIKMALFRGFISDEKLFYDLKAFKFKRFDGENLLFEAKFDDIEEKDILPGAGSGNENTKDNGRVPTILVRVKNKEYTSGIWKADDFIFEDNRVLGFSEDGKEKLKESKKVILPELSNEGIRLEHIGENAFKMAGIKSIKFPESLKSIGQAAFNSNELEELILGDEIESIASGAFANNVDLRKVKLPENLKHIPDAGFMGTAIDDLILPSGLQTIGKRSFSGCKLEKLEFPFYLKEIGDYAFSGCPLKSVNLNDGLEVIGKSTFNSKDLKEVLIPSSILDIKKNSFHKESLIRYEVIGDMISKTDKLYLEDRQGEDIKKLISYIEEMKEIDKTGSSDLEKVTSLVENIEALILKLNLEEDLKWNSKDFIYKDNILEGFSERGLLKFKMDKNLIIPSENDEGKPIQIIGKMAFNEKDVESLKLSEGILEIGDMSFRNTKIARLELPDSVEKIGIGSFANNMNNRSLKELKLSKNIREIGQGAFSFADLENLTLPEGTLEIGRNAFVNNDRLKSISLPNSIRKIGESAFKNNGLEKVRIPGSLENIERYSFLSGHINQLIIEEGVKEIGKEAFKKNMIDYVLIPSSVIKIDKGAFEENTNMRVEFKLIKELLLRVEKLDKKIDKSILKDDLLEIKSLENTMDLEKIIEVSKNINLKLDKLIEDNKVIEEDANKEGEKDRDSNSEKDEKDRESFIREYGDDRRKIREKDEGKEIHTKDQKREIPVLVKETEEKSLYADVEKTFWAYKILRDLDSKGIKLGYEDGSLRPNNMISRAELAVLLDKSFNLAEVDGNLNYNDIKKDEWYGKSIYKLSNLGILKGYEDGSFKPEKSITREELIKVIVLLVEMEEKKVIEVTSTKFKDELSISPWSKEYILKAYKKGLIKAYEDDSVRPKNPASRIEVFSILNNII